MTPLDSQLHAAWLSQLAREYSDICYQYGFCLHPPLLRISNSHSQLGSWSAGERTLSLSQHLISAHPWRLTLQVLKHEIAHQICDELLGRPDAGHGPLFRDTCTRLGLDASFHRASADLAEGLPDSTQGSATTERGRQIIDRVRKLMALGNSDNEHEAALAVQRASELLARHQLDFDGLAAEEELVHRTINTGSQTLPAYRKAICALLEHFFSVRVICASEYDPHTNCSYKTIELLGPEEAVAIAEHCTYFLENRLETLWMANRSAFAGNRRTARTSYFLGLLAGFRQTLEQGSKPHTKPAQAPPAVADLPMVQAQERLDAFVAFRYPRLRRTSGRANTLHGEAYRQAVVEGRTIKMHRPMAGDQPVRLLP
jgi:hypothetical protein